MLMVRIPTYAIFKPAGKCVGYFATSRKSLCPTDCVQISARLSFCSCTASLGRLHRSIIILATLDGCAYMLCTQVRCVNVGSKIQQCFCPCRCFTGDSDCFLMTHLYQAVNQLYLQRAPYTACPRWLQTLQEPFACLRCSPLAFAE